MAVKLPLCRLLDSKENGSLFRATRLLPVRSLQRGLDLKAPGFEQRLRDVLRVLVPARPRPQPSRPEVLIRGELVFAHDLFEFGDGRGDGPNRFGLAPVWISASL